MSTMEQPETAQAEPQSGRTPEGTAQCRRNALREGRRSMSEFPPEMQVRIDAHEAELREELKPRTPLERAIVLEIARGKVQNDDCHTALMLDAQRVRASADDGTWDENRREHINNIGARLSRDAPRVAPNLVRTKQGAEWCLVRWRGLRDSVRHNGRFSEPQRQLAFDLLGIEPILRDNPYTVPECDDPKGIQALIDREMARLEKRIEVDLETRDATARSLAQLGRPPEPDAATRRAKSDEARAYKRYTSALDRFQQVRMGTYAGPPIDPETGRPVPKGKAAKAEAGSPPQAGAETDPAAKAGPGSPSDSPEGVQDAPSVPDDRPVWVPDGITGENREMLQVLGTTLRQRFQEMGLGGVRILPPGDLPPTDVPAPQS
jgi:hypothetical protein